MGGSISAGFGYFSSGGFGGFNSRAALVLLLFPTARSSSPPSPGSAASAWGLSGGYGWGFFFSPDAKTVADLSGPFRTHSVTLLGWTVQYSVGQNANGEWIHEFALIPFGRTPGVSASAANSLTTPWSGVGAQNLVPFFFGRARGWTCIRSARCAHGTTRSE